MYKSTKVQNSNYLKAKTMEYTHKQLKKIRLMSGLSTAEAGKLVGFSISKNGNDSEYCSQWQRLESGKSKIKSSVVELFILKAFQPLFVEETIKDVFSKI